MGSISLWETDTSMCMRMFKNKLHACSLVMLSSDPTISSIVEVWYRSLKSFKTFFAVEIPEMETTSIVSVLITNKCAERLTIRQHQIPCTHHESIPSHKITKLALHQTKSETSRVSVCICPVYFRSVSLEENNSRIWLRWRAGGIQSSPSSRWISGGYSILTRKYS